MIDFAIAVTLLPHSLMHVIDTGIETRCSNKTLLLLSPTRCCLVACGNPVLGLTILSYDNSVASHVRSTSNIIR